MFRKLKIIVSLVVCFQLYSNASTAQEPASTSKPNKPTTNSVKKLFGIDSPYINVFRRNHPQGRSSPVYNAKFESIEGRQYLVGTDKAKDYTQTYWYLLDDVQLITFPAPAIEKEVKEKTAKPKTLADEVMSLKSRWEKTKKTATSQQVYVSKKKKQIKYLMAKIDNEKSETAERYKEEVKILEKEIQLHQAKIKDLNSDISSLRLKFLNKRSEAIEKGVHSSRMEIR